MDHAARLLEKGFQLVSVASDLAYVQQTANAAVAELRKRGLM